MDNLPMHIGQAKITACVAVGKLLVIHTKHVQDRRMQVMHVDFVFHCAKSKFVSSAVGEARFRATACQPCREPSGIVVTTVFSL